MKKLNSKKGEMNGFIIAGLIAIVVIGMLKNGFLPTKNIYEETQVDMKKSIVTSDKRYDKR